jgi:Kef-type K+ transport system membrane component KefB
MRRLIITGIILLIIMLLLTRLSFISQDHLMAESMMALGFTLVIAYLAGRLLIPLGLPKITGYLLAGILIGPYFLNLLSVEVVQNLQLIDNIALSLIALTAGGEFHYKNLKKQFAVINSALFGQTFIVMILLLLFTLGYHTHISFLQDETWPTIIGVGLLFGALSIATSPATTIAVITESRAKGPFTNFVLGVTVFKDVVVVLIFSVVLSIAKPLILHESSIQMSYMLTVFVEISLSMVAGIAAGAIILAYLKYVREQKVLFLLGFIIFCIELSKMFHLELILLFMVAGFFVQNFSRSGPPLIDAIEEISLPIFVTFFAIAGASLKIPVFLENWLLAVYLVFLRLLGTYLGTSGGGRIVRSDQNIQKYGWLGFIGQAGLTLGFAAITRRVIPGPIGIGISTLIISSITINQIIGPVLFRIALKKTGEIKRGA